MKVLPAIPEVSNAEAKKIYQMLERFYPQKQIGFLDVFRFESSLTFRPNLTGLCDGDLLARDGQLVRSNFRIWPLRIEKRLFFIYTDLFSTKSFHRVFPIYPDESDVFAKYIRVIPGERVLDLCTGSGIYAIVARSQGARVTASDVNDRCLEMGEFNEKLNGLSGIQWINSDLFQKFKNKRFDYIVCDPPFMPVSEFRKNKPSSSYYLHGAAGEDGLYFIKRIIKDLPLHLTRLGRFSLFVNVLGKRGELPLQNDLASSFLKHGKLLNLTYSRILPELNVLSLYRRRFSGSRNLFAWDRKLSKKYDSFQLYIIDGVLSDSNRVTRKDLSTSLPLNIREEAGKPPKKFSHNIYTNPWQYRLARFFHKIG